MSFRKQLRPRSRQLSNLLVRRKRLQDRLNKIEDRIEDLQPVEPKPAPAPEPPPKVIVNDKYDGKTREEWWTTRFPEQPVLYRAQDGNARDVRNFIFEHSYILDQVIDNYKLRGASDDETALKCCLFVQDNIRYVGDEEARGQVEYWQNSEDTITRGTGDCEDGAILMKSLTQCAGVPDWKVKIVAGMVKGGGHAYCTYIRDNDTQCVLDWCYWPNRLPVDDRKQFKDEENYYEIWFSFNNDHSYAETKVTYAAGKVQN
jgi:transglutaminase-like putative cysteine protease